MKSFSKRFGGFSLFSQRVCYLDFILLALALLLGGMAIRYTSMPQFVQEVWAALVDGGGTINTVAAFSGSNTIGNSIMSQSGSTINVAGNVSSAGYMSGTYFVDAGDSTYYVDPNVFSNLKSLAINNGLSINGGGVRDGSQGFLDVFSYIAAPILYDRDDSAYFIDMNGNSNLRNLQIQGNLGVSGNFGVSGTKSFVIDHPLKSGYQLVHASLEGPEAGVYYRGTSRLSNGKAKITLLDYFDALTRDHEATVLLTAKGETPFLLSYDKFDEKSFMVYGTKPDGEFDWEVKSIRSDVPPLEVERKK